MPTAPSLPEISPLRTDPRLADHTRRAHRQVAAALGLYRTFQPDLALHYWHYTDAITHLAWRWDAPPWTPPRPEPWRHVGRPVLDAYQLMDGWVGEFCRAVAPGTLLVIASDHGFSFSGHEHHQAPPGVLLAAGAGVRAGAVLDGAHLLDVAPTLLAALGLPLADELAGRPLPLFADGGRPPLRRVADYGWFTPTRSGAPRAHDVERETLERLRELGYVN